MSDYADDYRLLDLTPGCSLQALRAARRRLLKSWHPDHFPSGGDEKHRAEERIKRINAAFDRLTEYHRLHGALPLPTAAAPETASRIRPSAPTPTPREARAPRVAETAAESASNRDSTGILKPRNPIPWLIVLAALVFLGDSIVTDLGRLENPNATIADRPNATNQEHGDEHDQPIPRTEEHFAVGTTIDDVYHIQGAPTKADSGVWYYGKSKVYFANGVVTSWDNNPENPLHVAPSVDGDTNRRIFTLGSTKAEVRSIQGAPLVETEDLWDYGLSKVYFRADRVVGWDSSPMKPLKARK